MQINNRTKNFKNRLQIEREVLTIVNTSNKFTHLTGLTQISISKWADKQFKLYNVELIKKIVANLLIISRSAGMIADNSRAIVSENSVGGFNVRMLENLRTNINLIK